MLKTLKNIKIVINLFLSLLVFISVVSFMPVKKPKGITTVVIDAGHGGKDPGCNGAIHKEKEVTLAIALKLGKLIEENLKDVKVIYTRTTDVFVELEERAQIANRNNADLFISIHCNAAAKFVTYKDKNGKVHVKTWKDKKGKIHKKEIPNPVPYGSDTYVMGIKNEKGKMEVAKRENASMLLEDNYEKTYGGFDPNSDEAYIIMTLTTSAYVDQSAKFASKVQHEYATKAGRIDKGVQRQSIWVLWRTAMPSILTEVGFLTNPIEEKFLGSEKGQTYMASAIFRALRNYKNEVEGNTIKYNDELENQEALENENLLYEKEHPELKNLTSTESSEDTTKEEEVKNDDAIKTAQYKKTIEEADSKLKERKLEDAKKLYNEALLLKKDDSYSKNKLSEIVTLETQIKKSEDDKKKANEQLDKQYSDLILKADKLTADKKWEDAKKKYQEALIVKPGEKYPKQKIKEIEEQQAALHDNSNDTSTASTNDLLKNYTGTTTKEGTTTTVKNEVEFKIQFASSDKEIGDVSTKYKGLENISFYKAGNMLKYTAGKFTNPEEAVKYQTKVRGLGYKDAFVVAFKNGNRIDYNEALKLIGKKN